MLAWSVVVHLALFLACVGYAALLARKDIYEWYHPDKTWWVVAGGVILVGLAGAAECALGVLPWLALGIYATLFVTAGIPIAYWQERQAADRHRIEQEADTDE